MSKRTRQYIGLLVAVLAYYLIHEGAHFLYACSIGSFKQINFMGLGVQIDIFAERMSSTQLGWFCLVGALASLLTAYGMMLLAPLICRSKSKLFRACMYYCTIALLFLDPLYLSLLCGFFGGGDMNGISLLIPEWIARLCFGALIPINGLLFWKVVLPIYTKSFQQT